MTEQPKFLRNAAILLLIGSVATFAVACFVRSPTRDLLINLSATFIGLLVAAFGLDAAIKSQRRAEWMGVQERVSRRLLHVATATVSSIRTACGFGPDIHDQRALALNTSSAIRAEMVRIAENVLLPSLSQIRNLDQHGWQALTMNLQASFGRIDQLLSMFGRALPPATVQSLMDIQTNIESMLGLYQVWRDLLGVPSEQLPIKKDGSRTDEMKWAVTELAIKTTRPLLNDCITLMNALQFKEI
jgi:hypothetical protein